MKFKSRIITLSAFIVLTISTAAPICMAEPDTGNVQNGVAVPIAGETKPYHSNELKHVLKKFLVAMALVGGSCLVLYFILSTYKRLKTAQQDEPVNIDVSKNLTTPDTIDEATRLFIEKF